MNRRDLLTLLGGAAAWWPVVAWGQREQLPLIGYMHGGRAEDNREEVAALENGLKQSGFTVGQTVLIEYQWAEGRYERLRSIAKGLVDRPVALIFAGTPVAAIAAKQESTAIPIVFQIGSDPVRDGLVASLNRPGGNITGSTFFSNLLTSKRMGLMQELLPQTRSVALLVNPKNANAAFEINEANEAANALRLENYRTSRSHARRYRCRVQDDARD